jgi:cell division cycle 2-like protein
MSSRWTDTAEDLAEAARLKTEKAARRAAKAAQKAREEAAAAEQKAAEEAAANAPPSKRQKTENYTQDDGELGTKEVRLMRFDGPEIGCCRHVEETYERLNHIEEGSYGIVSRAKDMHTGEIVALKRLKLERETDGFPITSLREVTTLMAARSHVNVVKLREVVMGDSLKEYVISIPNPSCLFSLTTRKCVHSNGLHRTRPQNPPRLTA